MSAKAFSCHELCCALVHLTAMAMAMAPHRRCTAGFAGSCCNQVGYIGVVGPSTD